MIGRLIDHYRITAKLDEGGMGVVYRARDERLPREVAIKVIASAKVADKDACLRFRNEAFSLARLNHPNIGTIFDYISQDGQEFIVMEYVPGMTLEARLKGMGLPQKEVVRLGCQLAEGLSAAHEKGVVHRDLKPKNIMITPDGRLKILDFGIAVLLRRTDNSPDAKTIDLDVVTQTPQSGGTPPYMAPEQLSGEKEDQRTDLYAAGNILYEMATGQRPFYQGRDSRKDILYSSPKAPSQLESSFSPQFDEIVLKCLEKDPDDRYQTAKELQVDLRRLGTRNALVPKRKLVKFRAFARWSAVALAGVFAAMGLYYYWLMQSNADPPRFRQWEVSTGEKLAREPAISPDGMKIVFVQQSGGGSQICVIPYNGGSSRAIIDSIAEYADPTWFPGSDYVAYAAYQDGKWKIFGRGESGDEETMLVENARHPAVSPDGKRIAFTRILPDGKQRIGVAFLAGIRVVSDIRTITGDQDGPSNHTDPAWSWDSSRICYRTGKGLRVIPGDGGKSFALTNALDNEPAWSPGGRFIYFSSGRESSTSAIWRVKADGSQAQRITTGPGPASHPTLSRSGARLAYCSEEKGYSLTLLDTTSGQNTTLSPLKGARVAALSPMGDKIAAVMQKGDLGFYCIYIEDIERGKPKSILRRIVGEAGATPTFPAFSPDGKYLVYSWARGEEMDLWTVPTDGGAPDCLVSQPGRQQHPAWSFDGSRIAYISVENGRNKLCVLPVRDARPAGSARTLDTGGVEPWWPTWSADGEKIAFLGRNLGGAKSEEYAIYEVTVHGEAQVRQLTREDARVRHAHWLTDTQDLLVSGLWGEEQCTLRRISSLSGKIVPTALHIIFGEGSMIGHFDVSCDGRSLLYLREEELRGSTFLQESYDGKY